MKQKKKKRDSMRVGWESFIAFPGLREVIEFPVGLELDCSASCKVGTPCVWAWATEAMQHLRVQHDKQMRTRRRSPCWPMQIEADLSKSRVKRADEVNTLIQLKLILYGLGQPERPRESMPMDLTSVR